MTRISGAKFRISIDMDTYTGIVEGGSQRAAGLGYPTINIPLADTEVSGIYAALVKVGEE